MKNQKCFSLGGVLEWMVMTETLSLGFVSTAWLIRREFDLFPSISRPLKLPHSVLINPNSRSVTAYSTISVASSSGSCPNNNHAPPNYHTNSTPFLFHRLDSSSLRFQALHLYVSLSVLFYEVSLAGFLAAWKINQNSKVGLVFFFFFFVHLFAMSSWFYCLTHCSKIFRLS